MAGKFQSAMVMVDETTKKLDMLVAGEEEAIGVVNKQSNEDIDGEKKFLLRPEFGAGISVSDIYINNNSVDVVTSGTAGNFTQVLQGKDGVIALQSDIAENDLQSVTDNGSTTDNQIVITGAGTLLQLGEEESIPEWKRLHLSVDPDNNIVSFQGVQRGVGYNQRIVLQPQGGNVGIGKTPAEAFDVNGNGKFSGSLDISGNITGGANLSVAGSFDVLGSGELNVDGPSNFAGQVIAATAQVTSAPVEPTDVVRLEDLQTVNVRSSSPSFALNSGGFYTYTGAGTSNANLPELSTSLGRRFVIMNEAGGTLNIVPYVSDKIYSSGMAVSGISIDDGETCVLYNNGAYWFKQL